ncbi:MAG: hypothetical protein CMN30_25240 [Sandaracinus sp.]|nr:hypothetical protein [Sandaracinus sp.]
MRPDELLHPAPRPPLLRRRGLRVALLALALGGLGGAVDRARFEPCRLDTGFTQAQALRSATTMFVAEHPDAGCPCTHQLVDGGFIDADKSLLDPWGHPFTIECDGTRVRIVSAGADGLFGTRDDID